MATEVLSTLSPTSTSPGSSLKKFRFNTKSTLVSPKPSSSGQPGPSRLEKLPTELLCRITYFLDSVGAACLSMVNRRLHQVIEYDQESLTRCARWIIMARVEQDFLNEHHVIGWPNDPAPSKRRWSLFGASARKSTNEAKLDALTCALCKTKHGIPGFQCKAANIRVLAERNYFPNQRSMQRLCPWHLGKVVRISTPPGANLESGRWISSIQECCMHCGQIQCWGSCTCSEPTTRQGVTSPGCEYCPMVKIRVYERQRTQGDKQEISWKFQVGKDNTLYVLESRGKSSGRYSSSLLWHSLYSEAPSFITACGDRSIHSSPKPLGANKHC